MKKIILSVVFISGLFLTGCEKGEFNDETAEIEFEISKTDKGDVNGPGSGDDDDDDEL